MNDNQSEMPQTWRQLRNLLNTLEDDNPALDQERDVVIEGENYLTEATMDDGTQRIKDEGSRP